MPSIKLKWKPLRDSEVKGFNLYRSMLGFKTKNEAPFGIVSGETLILKVSSEEVQTIVFQEDLEIDSLVIFLNSKLKGAKAYKSYYNNSLIIRANKRTDPGFIELIGGLALNKMGETPRTITEKSENELIANVLAPTYEFSDYDGVLDDYYGISTIDNLDNESSLSTLAKASSFSPSICVVEGTVIDLQGQRLADVTVSAKIVSRPQVMPNHSAIIKDAIHVLTGEDGRFSLPIIQGAQVIFEINQTRISDTIEIPAQEYVFFDDLPIYEGYQFIDSNY